MRGLTKIEKERQNKKSMGEEIEKILEMGHDNEDRGIKAVQEEQKRKDKIEKEENAVSEWKLTDAKNTTIYKDLLMREARKLMYESEYPRGFSPGAMFTTKGLVVYFRDDIKKKWYAKGMTVSGKPQYDLNCIARTIGKALDGMENIDRQRIAL